jgi:hypothetical protein
MKRFLIAAAVLLCATATGSAQDIPLSKILVEGEGWKVAAKDLPGVAVLNASPTDVLVDLGGPLAKIRPDGKVEKLPAQGIGSPAVTFRGDVIYQIDAENKSLVARWPDKRQAKKVNDLVKPSCLTLWPDESQLVIGDAGGKYLWTARIEKDGGLGGVDRYYSLRVKPGGKASGVKAMVMDAGNLLYAATPLGVQVFDPTGRLCGVILPPAKEEMTAITIGGEKGDTLFVAAGDKVYSRKIQGKAVYTLKKDK